MIGILYGCAANLSRVPSNTKTKPITNLSAGRHASLKCKMREIGEMIGKKSTPSPDNITG